MVHIFDHIGKYPFRLKNVSHGDSHCDHCGTTIKFVFIIEDSEGKCFNVGSRCVEKTGDTGLIKESRKSLKQLKLREKKEKELSYIKKIQEQQNNIYDYYKKNKNKMNHILSEMECPTIVVQNSFEYVRDMERFSIGTIKPDLFYQLLLRAKELMQ